MAGVTVLAECLAEYPLQVTRGRCLRGRVQLVVLLQSGGLLDGDLAEIDVQVGAGAHLEVTTLAATQVHAGRSTQQIRVNVARGGVFSYVPRAIVPHARADFLSETRIELEEGGRALCAEVLSPGRVSHGETFLYTRVRVALDAFLGGALIARERAVLTPSEETRCAQFGDFTHVATAYVLGAKEDGSFGFAQDDNEHSGEARASMQFKSSELARGGWFVRGVAQRAVDLDDVLRQLNESWWLRG